MQDLKPCRLSYEQMDEETKYKVSLGVFALVVLLALLPPMLLLNIYALTITVCCPLIATVLPGFFFYINARMNSDPDQDSKLTQAQGIVYACFGLFMMPLFLMLTMYSI